MRTWRKILVVTVATGTLATASVAAMSVAAAQIPETAARPASATCDHHTPAMDAMHRGMLEAHQAMERMHESMGGGMMGGGIDTRPTLTRTIRIDEVTDARQ